MLYMAIVEKGLVKPLTF